jgi:hypothetical protein
MAISHIPRSVGHNFAPEYQISAVPFNAKNSDGSRFVIKKATGKIVGTVAAANDGDLTDDVWTRTDNTLSDDDLKDNDAGNADIANLHADYGVIRKYEFKKITQWLQFKTVGQATNVYFSRKEAVSSTTNCLELAANEETLILPIRCVNIYMPDAVAANQTMHIRVGLTSIDRSEFTEMIETFLGDTE